MPDANLPDALDALRERYSQRQRVITTLMAAFQALNKGYSKAHKILSEYAEGTGSDVASSALATFSRNVFKEDVADPLMPDLRRESKVLAQITGVLKETLSALRSEPVDVVRLGKAYHGLQALKIQDNQIMQALPAIGVALTDAQNAMGNTLGTALRDAFAAQGIVLHGLMPNVEAGRFEITINFQTRSAALSYGKELLVRKIPLSVESILKGWQHAQKTIYGRDEDSALWLRQFYEAYELTRRGHGEDKRVNIIDCYFQLVLLRQKKGFRAAPSKSGFIDYSRAQFSYDLDAVVNRTQLDVKGLRPALHFAIKANTDNPEKSLWVVEGDGPHDGRYIGDVVFDR